MRAYDNELQTNCGKALGVFSSHWAAIAAMIRLGDPSFRSLGGDKPEDLEVEAQVVKVIREST